jgi:hypothetical protein
LHVARDGHTSETIVVGAKEYCGTFVILTAREEGF